MPYELRWYQLGHVIYIKGLGVVSSDDLINIRRALMHDFAAQVLPPYAHLLNDVSEVRQFNFTTVQAIHSADQTPYSPDVHERLSGWRIYFGGSSQNSLGLYHIVHQFENQRVRTVATLKEAILFLQQVDERLADLPIIENP